MELSKKRTVVIIEEESSPSTTFRKEWPILMEGVCKERSSQSEKTKIQKVSSMLRKIGANNKFYDPTVVSIGPYHHCNSELAAVEKLKIPTAQQFFEGKSEMDVLYSKFLEMASNAMEFYEEGTIISSNYEEFMWMMFLNGCFVLHFIHCLVHFQLNNLKIKHHLIVFVRQDLFLVENQLPYVVLETLLHLRFPGGEEKDMMKNFIKEEVCPFYKGTLPSSANFRTNEKASDDRPLHLLELLRKELLGNRKWGGSNNGSWNSYRSVNELISLGIDFKSSNTHHLSEFTYKPKGCGGELSVPQIAIDDSTERKFLNLIAYETCLIAPEDYAVTSYICFMDSLIDDAKDVKELRSKGILLNSLGSDEQVASLFNRLSDNLVPNPNAYGSVKENIEKHYKNKRKIWIAEMKQTHFRNPWTILALFGAFFLLALTITQTHFTVFPRQ